MQCSYQLLSADVPRLIEVWYRQVVTSCRIHGFVRKADIELASDLFGLFGTTKEGFWKEFKGLEEGRLGLLTYYIARKTREEGAGAV